MLSTHSPNTVLLVHYPIPEYFRLQVLLNTLTVPTNKFRKGLQNQSLMKSTCCAGGRTSEQ